jgi:hypothetical protein
MKLNSRGPLTLCVVLAAAGLVSCGRPPLMGNRPYPPDFDGYGYPRAMVAWDLQGSGQATLQLIDVKHDTVSNQEYTIHSYTISGFTGTNALTIQDFPGQQLAYVFADGGGSGTGAASFQPANTGTDRAGTSIPGIAPGTTSAYITGDFQYVYSVSPITTHASSGYLTTLRTSDGSEGLIPLASANKLAPSPGAASGSSSLLIFAANANNGSNNLYQLVGVGQNPIYQCTQQLIPTLAFDKPINALYSSDGTSAFIFNCGPECGGTTASVSIVSTAAMAAAAAPVFQQKLGCNVEPTYTPPPVTIPVQNIPVPGGVTKAVQLGTTLFVTGQALYPGGEFGGFLTAIDLTGKTPAATYVIGDGIHLRMSVGDGGAPGVSNTLWIAAGGPTGSCSDGEQATLTTGITGCVTMVPIAQSGTGYGVAAGACTAANPAPVFAGAKSCPGIVIEPSGQGGAGGVAPIIGYNKTYTVEGGTVYLYSTMDGSALSNLNVQVPGYAKDIAFIDGATNTAP